MPSILVACVLRYLQLPSYRLVMNTRHTRSLKRRKMYVPLVKKSSLVILNTSHTFRHIRSNACSVENISRRQNLELYLKTTSQYQDAQVYHMWQSICNKAEAHRTYKLSYGQCTDQVSALRWDIRRYSNLIQHKNWHHMKIKKKVKDFICHCGEIFHSKKKLEWHKEIHDEKPKCCTYCSEHFVHASSLTRHIRKAHDCRYVPKCGHEVENMECKLCGYGKVHCQYTCVCTVVNVRTLVTCVGNTSQLSGICSCTGGLMQHAVQNPWSVPCARVHSFTVVIILRTCTHITTCGHTLVITVAASSYTSITVCVIQEHEVVKSFSCNVCGKPFHRSYYLQEHLHVHRGAQPFACHICGKASRTKSNHNKHVKIHHAREPVNTEGWARNVSSFCSVPYVFNLFW